MKLRYFISPVLFILISCQVYGQEFIYAINKTPGDLNVNIQVGHTNLRVLGHAKNTILIKSLKELTLKDSRAEGLEPVTPWPDNTGLGVHISEDENGVSIIKSRFGTSAKYEILIPENANVNIEETEWGRGNFDIGDIKGNLNIESGSSDISIKGISGSVRAETTSGDMTIEIPPPGLGMGHEVGSVSGVTNLMIPRDAAYSFDLSTITGNIQTDFELTKEIEYKGSILRRISKAKEIETDLNGGGDMIEASTVSGLLKISFNK